nr:hypothetical protein [Tanacetum cinerariifolium]
MKEKLQFEGGYVGKRHSWLQKLFSLIVFTFALMGFLFLLYSITGSIFEPSLVSSMPEKNSSDAMYGRLASMASSALIERELKKNESKFWKESYWQASVWSPCADRKGLPRAENLQRNNGYILVSANGGLNQQRVADLPPHLQSPDFKEIGSLVTDADISKEATQAEYIEKILPILLKNGVVHFLGYGNRLGFDPLPSDLQRLRCKCNYHALKFVPKIQETGALLIRRIRKSDAPRTKLDNQLLGNFITGPQSNRSDMDRSPFNYIALHLRFEVDMVAYSLCEFGGGQLEKTELQAYREDHFPLLMQRLKKSNQQSSLVSGFRTYYGGGRAPTLRPSKMRLAKILSENQTISWKDFVARVTNMITEAQTVRLRARGRSIYNQPRCHELQMSSKKKYFKVYDEGSRGSQQSSLVSGFRTYYGGGRASTLRPSKMRLAKILSENQTISWKDFEARVTNMITEAQTECASADWMDVKVCKSIAHHFPLLLKEITNQKGQGTWWNKGRKGKVESNVWMYCKLSNFPKGENRMSRMVKRHRLIYSLLNNELQSVLHALSIEAKMRAEVGI